MKYGFGSLEKFVMAHGGWSAVAGLAIVYLPKLVGGVDWGPYGPLVLAISAGVISTLKLYFGDNRAVVTAANAENKGLR